MFAYIYIHMYISNTFNVSSYLTIYLSIHLSIYLSVTWSPPASLSHGFGGEAMDLLSFKTRGGTVGDGSVEGLSICIYIYIYKAVIYYRAVIYIYDLCFNL